MYDCSAISAVADELHVMAYDFHGLGSPHPGPVSPLGWVKGICQYIQSTGHADKFVLGLPNYGIAGPANGTTTFYDTSLNCINLTGGQYDSVSNHMDSCIYVNTLVAKETGRAPHANTSQGLVYFDDIASLEEKVVAAQQYGLAGITY